MTRRITIFFLLIYLFFVWGCTSTINKEYLSQVELERFQAVKVFMEEKDLNGHSYKVIQKVHGYSCPQESRNIHEQINYRDESVEQVKILAMKAGGNAIINLVCIYEKTRMGCGVAMECFADAILLDKYDADGNPIKVDENIPKAKVEEDCDPGMESCN